MNIHVQNPISPKSQSLKTASQSLICRNHIEIFLHMHVRTENDAYAREATFLTFIQRLL